MSEATMPEFVPTLGGPRLGDLGSDRTPEPGPENTELEGPRPGGDFWEAARPNVAISKLEGIVTADDRPEITVSTEADGVPIWLNYVVRRLRDLATLRLAPQEGVPVPSARAIERSFVEIRRVLRLKSPAPSVIPTIDGGVLFSWRRPKWTIEVEIGDAEPEVWAQSEEDPDIVIDGLLTQWQDEVAQALETASEDV